MQDFLIECLLLEETSSKHIKSVVILSLNTLFLNPYFKAEVFIIFFVVILKMLKQTEKGKLT